MNRNKVFSDLKPVADNKKHAFPYDRRDVYSIKAGMLNPVFVLDTIPDSSYDINSVNIIRTDAIQSTPFARMSSNMEYHFVPYSHLFRNFEKIYYERGDNMRNTNNSSSSVTSTKIPTFNFKDFFNAASREFLYARLLQDMYDLANARLPLVVSTGTFPYFNLNSNSSASLDFNQLKMVTEVFGFALGKTESYTAGSAFWLNDRVLDVFNRLCIEDTLRNFDMLGYGNLEAIFDAAYKDFVSMNDMRYRINGEIVYGRSLTAGTFVYDNLLCTFIGDIFTAGSDVPPLSTKVTQFLADCVYNIHEHIFRLNVDSDVEYSFELDVHPTILRMAAYLKVWSDFYRNSQYDIDKNYSYYFNYDYYVDSDGDIPLDKVFEMLQPRYRQWKKDVFTGGYPNAQFGSVAVSGLENPVELQAINPQAPGTNSVLRAAEGTREGKVYQNTDGTGVANVVRFNIDTGVSALSIRQALSMQRYRETVLRAGNRLTSLQRAQFGDSSRYLEDEYCRFLNAYSQTIDFNSVATTAEGNDRVVGELASNGVSTYGGNGFKFDSHDFGIIVGLQYILPEAEYESYGIDPMVTKSVTSDFYKAAFQNLGLAPVFGFNYNLFKTFLQSMPTPQRSISLNNTVFSYLARYWEYKVQYDKVHGLFYNSAPFTRTGLNGHLGDFANYVTPRPAVFPENLSLPALYVNPNCIDSIFYAGVNLQQGSDPFKVNMNHTGTMVLPMSVIGLPNI